MGTWTVAPALNRLLADANARWPDRLRGRDGTIGDANHFGDIEEGDRAHGEHVPTDNRGVYWDDAVVRARDIDVRRPDGSQFGDELVQLLVADGKVRERIAYIIHKGVIYSRVRDWAPAPNSGHEDWVHVSLRNNSSSRADASTVAAAAADVTPWFGLSDVGGVEFDMQWPDCAPFEEMAWYEVSTPAGLKARTAPRIAPETELRRDGKLVTVNQGYEIRAYGAAFRDGIWWIMAKEFCYAACGTDGKPYVKKRSA